MKPKINYTEMKKLILILCLVSGLYGCATKEELIPELTQVSEIKKIPTPFERIQDSPTCFIPEHDIVKITSSVSIPGITGDVDLSSTDFRESFDYCILDEGDYWGKSRIIIEIDGGYVQTGIYTTVESGTWKQGDINIQIAPFQPSSPYPRVTVLSGQKVLIVRDGNRARIKFCNLKLDMSGVGNGNGTGSIEGEIDSRIN